MYQQLSFWDGQSAIASLESGDVRVAPHCERLDLPDADVRVWSQYFPVEQSDCYLHQLRQDIAWQQDWMQIYDKSVPLPRLTAWYGEANTSYAYSGIEMHPHAWSPVLMEIKSSVESLLNQNCDQNNSIRFNSVLLNWYRNGQDSVSWHSDNESELEKNPIIASVSFGATRRFSLKHKWRKDLATLHLNLVHGSVLLMQGNTQACWLHQVPKTAKPVGDRINLTFRIINVSNGNQ